ncbi:complex I 24 kDa subunit family protein [Anaerorhabdus furcosa]|uniref:NADP-reducing hydrogenase subunit HndA n=1 Tax=Anaerorhabdus furcosa TaxID=118967 RepID=A0A1T4PJY8_9FIRM|nr:NAD(P)H-dependent oxidoreductase subunit E [Anaerorhabdus furcosa]SJZ91208.1 NADP-reducing hydrogenase subunit HndA [Anaerorhabdus furcosa]
MEKLNAESLRKIDEIVAKHESRPGPIKLMLHDVQHELGYVPFEAMEKISNATNASVAEVYGVVTFYSQFTTEPKGKHIINVCMGTACYVKGAQNLVNDVINMTGATVNGTSSDGLFSLDATRCLGACGLAPVVIIDGKVYGNADSSKIISEIIQSILDSERKPMGA